MLKETDANRPTHIINTNTVSFANKDDHSSIRQDNFNVSHHWKELEYSANKLVAYMNRNKISIEISEVLLSELDSEEQKIKTILPFIDKIFNENKELEKNVTFLEFYRLLAIYFTSHNRMAEALEIMEKFIEILNKLFYLHPHDVELDVNLLVQRDKFILTKAQIFFWQNKLDESLQLINQVITFYTSRNVSNDPYSIKMTSFICVVYSYKAWIIYQQKRSKDEAIAELEVALRLLKANKQFIFETFEQPDYREVYKRQIGLYEQYFKLLSADKDSNVGTFVFESEKYYKTAVEIVTEIIKVMSMGDFELDEVYKKEHLLYYYTVAVYLTLKPNNSINELKKCVLLVTYAYTTNLTLEGKLKVDLTNRFVDLLDLFGDLIIQNGNRAVFDEIKERIAELIALLQSDGRKQIPKLKEKDIYKNYERKKIIKNYALENMKNFDVSSLEKTINPRKINEIFVVDIISRYFLRSLGTFISNNKNIISSFDKNLSVLESLIGYMIFEDDMVVLMTFDTFIKTTSTEEILKIPDAEIKGILNDVTCIRTERSGVFFMYNFFDIKKGSAIREKIIMLNLFHSLNDYLTCIVLLNSIIHDFIAVKNILVKGRREARGLVELLIFFSFVLVQIYITQGEYSLALATLLGEVKEYVGTRSYSLVMYNLLTGICLSKLRYCDLGAVMFGSAIDIVKNVVDDKGSIIFDAKKSFEDWEKPILMLLSAAKLMRFRCVEKFQYEVANANNFCFNCKRKLSETSAFACFRCKRPSYCSQTCQNKDKALHTKICDEYQQHFKQINEIIESYVKI